MKRHFVPAGHAAGFEINKLRKVSSNPGESYLEPKIYEEMPLLKDVPTVCCITPIDVVDQQTQALLLP